MGQFQSKGGGGRAEVHHSGVGNQSRESRQPSIQERLEKQQSSSEAHRSSGPASGSKSTRKLHQSQMSTDSSDGQVSWPPLSSKRKEERRERPDTSRNSHWVMFSLSDQIDQVQHSLVGNKFRESKQPSKQEQSEKQPSSSWDQSNQAKASVSKSPKKVQQCQTLSSDSCYGGETLDKLIKKRVIPKIIVTGPLQDEMSGTSVDDLPESKTIRDVDDYGSYSVHTKPSTIEAYQVRKEAP